MRGASSIGPFACRSPTLHSCRMDDTKALVAAYMGLCEGTGVTPLPRADIGVYLQAVEFKGDLAAELQAHLA
jgi:hypothetical protein